jgi:hypothetical protein
VVHAKQPSLLAGPIFDESSERLTPSHAVKKGTRYRYYVSRSLIVGTAKDKSRRIPAANLETLFITKFRSFLADEGAVLNVIREEHVNGAAQRQLIACGVKIAKEIESLTPDRIRVVLMTLISRVDIGPDCIAEGVIPANEADDLFVTVGVFIHWEAKDDKKIQDFNYRATKEAIARAIKGEPKASEVTAKKESAHHPFAAS